MSDNNQHNNNNNNQQGGRSGFPPNLGGGGGGGGGVDHAMWAQAMAQQSQAKHNSGQTFNPADSTQLLASFRQLQQNNGGNPNQNQQNQNQNISSPSATQQQANILLQKALQEANARNGQLRGGGQLQIPSGSGQVGIAGQHALLQALLANNQHVGQQQQQFPGGPPSFNPNQPQFSLQLPNQHQQQQQQQQQQHHNPQQQQQQQQQQNPQLNNGRQGANIPPAMVAILSNMGQQGTNMIKDWHQGNLSGEQMVQLKQLLAAHQSRQPKSTNMAQQQQSNQMANQNSSHERNASGSSQPLTQAQQQQHQAIVNMTNEQLGKVITSLTTKIKNLESSLANGQIPAGQVERAKVAMGEWTPQLRALVRESQARNLTLVQNGNTPNIHSSPNPAFNQPNPHQNQFVNNGLPPNFNNSPNLQARPNPGASFNAPVDPSQQRTSFFKRLSEMFQRKGIVISSSPMVEGTQIDLFNLYAKVAQEGGSENVRARNLWPVVGAHLGLSSSSGPDGIPRSTPDTANQVADIFGTYLSSFEDAWKNPASDARLLNQSPQLGQQQQQQQHQPQQQQQQPQPPHAPEINDAVLERLSQMPQAQRDSITLPAELSRRLEVYIAQKNANLANNNGSSPQVQPGAIGGQQNSATFAWARQQQQYAEASARASGNQSSSSMGGAVVGGVPPRPASGGVGQQPSQDAPRPFTAPTPEETQKSKLLVASMVEQIVEKLRATQKEVEGLSDEEKTEITTALRDLQGQIGEAEKRLTLFRILSHSSESTTACNRVTHMIAMWKNAFWNASQGRIVIGRNDIMTLRSQIVRFIQYVHTTVQTLMQGNRPQQNDQQRQLQQQQFLQQQQLQAQQQLQQAAALQQQQQQDQSQLATSLPDPSTFAGRLRPEDLRAPPPPKRARTSSVGGIASPSPAATTPAELRTPINAEQSPPANGKSPASSKKGTPKDSKSSLGGAANKKEKSSARKSSTSTGGRSTLDQVKEEMEKRDREEDVVEVPAQGPSVPSGVVATDPASVLGLQMDGWEERRRQEEVRAAAKDPVSFFQTQWNNLHQAQLDASNAGGVPNTFHDGGGPNGLDHTAIARAMRDIRQPSAYGSSSSSYPIASTSSLPYNHLSYSSNPMQDSNQPASPKSPVEDAFDISFFLDASQYEDEEAEEEVAVPTEDDGGAANSQGSSSRKVGSSSSSDPRPIDAQTPDLLHSSGPHDESPASVKEAISPPRLLPFRSSTDTNTNTNATASSSSNLSAPLTNRSTPNPFARTSTSTDTSSANAGENLSVLIPSSIPGDTNPSSAKSISPLPLQTPLGENGMEIWSEMGEDSYFSGGGVGGGFDWEGTQLEGTNGSSWLINST